MSARLFAFDDEQAPAARLADALGIPLSLIELHRFPDGEGLPVLPQAAESAVIYRSLDRPDAKLMPLLLAADAARRTGALRVTLVAPYMPYLRQDMVFASGQPLSRDVIGGVLGPHFERIVTVDPHLHRTASLDPVFAPAKATVLSAARTLALELGGEGDPIVVGPDSESRPWVTEAAAALGAEVLVFDKVRSGDRKVALSLPPQTLGLDGRRVILIDDICSSGATLQQAVRLLRAQGASRIDIGVVHALFAKQDEDALKAAGADRVISTDSCVHPSNTASLAGLLAAGLAGDLSS